MTVASQLLFRSDDECVKSSRFVDREVVVRIAGRGEISDMVATMLARRSPIEGFVAFNERWGAPYGHQRFVVKVVRRIVDRLPAALRRPAQRAGWFMRLLGPFAVQPNTWTRAVEYPWVVEQLAGIRRGRVLEIGGALSGLQFVLAAMGHEVHNVDPFVDYGDGHYELDPLAIHERMNDAFRTSVTLHRTTLPQLTLSEKFDAVICVSTIEHLTPEQCEETLRAATSILKPGGLVVLTVDLFLNIAPFTARLTNHWGSNFSIAWLQSLVGGSILSGDVRELYGYDEFSNEDVLARLEEFEMGRGYPQLAQLVAFRVGS